MAMFELDSSYDPQAKLKVIGLGGAGGNVVNNMIEANLVGVEFIVANTDLQALNKNRASNKIQLGAKLTKGLGAGGNPDVGRKSATEDLQEIAMQLEGSDMIFITAGMGGGTGTGSAPIVAQAAKELGVLTVAVVTVPFGFEGKRKLKIAEEGIETLEKEVDALIRIPNQRLLEIVSQDIDLMQAFKIADQVLLGAVQGISDIIQKPGIMNVDFADVKAIMKESGLALMGTGFGEGDNRAEKAATAAIKSPLLDNVEIDKAMGLLVNVSGKTVTLGDISQAVNVIQQAAHDDAQIKVGAVYDENLGDKLKVTVISTGLQKKIMKEITQNEMANESEEVNKKATYKNRETQIPLINTTIPVQNRQSCEITSQQSVKPMPVVVAGANMNNSNNAFEESDIDIPTFIRKHNPEI